MKNKILLPILLVVLPYTALASGHMPNAGPIMAAMVIAAIFVLIAVIINLVAIVRFFTGSRKVRRVAVAALLIDSLVLAGTNWAFGDRIIRRTVFEMPPPQPPMISTNIDYPLLFFVIFLVCMIIAELLIIWRVSSSPRPKQDNNN